MVWQVEKWARPERRVNLPLGGLSDVRLTAEKAKNAKEETSISLRPLPTLRFLNNWPI